MKKLKLYKVLRGLTSPYQNFKYELNKVYHCPDIDMNKSISCSRGLYAVDIDGLLYSWREGYRVYECEAWGKRVEFDEFIRRYEYLKLIRYVPYSELKRLAKDYEDKVDYKLSEALFPVNPFKGKSPRIQEKHIQLLKNWVSVRASAWGLVWCSVWDSAKSSVGISVCNSVRDSVSASVWTSVSASVWALVWDSVEDSFGAYISSLFPKIKKWKYIQHEEGVNPFQPCIDLWRAGLVPSFNGEIWRLLAGKDAEVVYKLSD